MSIVLRGLGIGVDTGSTIVAFGLARDVEAGESVETVVANADVSQLFVIDFGLGKRKPTKAEIRRFQRIAAMVGSRGLQFTERKGRRKGQVEFDVSPAPILRKAA